MITNAKRYRVLKEILTVKNPRWLKPGEEFKATPSSSRIRALLEHGYIEEIPEKPKTVDDLKIGDECYEICGTLALRMQWVDDALQIESRAVGDIALTKEAAEKRLEWRRAKEVLERDTKGFKPDWRNRFQEKYYVAYEIYFCGRLVARCSTDYNLGGIVFASQEDAEASIEAHEKEWKIYLGVEE